MQKLSIIIVNWNSGNYLKDCVDSVILSKGLAEDEIEIIIVDNASADDSYLFAENKTGVKLIKSKINLGFAKACNIGVNSANAKYILLLNPDTLVKTDTLQLSLSFLENNPQYSVLGVKQITSDTKVQRSCCRIPTFKTAFNAFSGLNKVSASLFPSFKMTEWSHDENRVVGHVIGSFLMMEKSVWLDVGGMDEDYFLYYEDIDLSARLGYSQKKIFYFAGAEIIHVGGGTSKQIKSQRLFYSLRSRLIYVGKHFKGIEKFGLKFTIYVIEPLVRLSMSIIRFRFKSSMEIIRAFWKLYFSS